jgi:hypothetical protein
MNSKVAVPHGSTESAARGETLQGAGLGPWAKQASRMGDQCGMIAPGAYEG